MKIFQAAGLRFHNELGNLSIIADAVNCLLPHVDKVFVAIRTELDKTGAMESLPQMAPGRVFTLAPAPWGDKQFSHILNGIAFEAGRNHGITEMLFISPECVVPESVLSALKANFDDDTLAVGPVLPGHSFEEGEHEIRGSIIPWNQCNLVNIKKLMEGPGFAMAGDSFWDTDNAGVEEVVSYALAQHVYGKDHAKVVLLKTPEQVALVQGHVTVDAKRAAWNAESNPMGKLGLKDPRPCVQMARLHRLVPGRVIHRSL